MIFIKNMRTSVCLIKHCYTVFHNCKSLFFCLNCSNDLFSLESTSSQLILYTMYSSPVTLLIYT